MKYAPANADGLKPYIVEIWDFGRLREKLVFAESASDARWKGYGRKVVGSYVKKVWRATPDDMARHTVVSEDG